MGRVSIDVLVVDDDPLVRSALSLMLGSTTKIRVVGEASNGQECLELVAAHPPTVVLMDLRMPVMGGIEAIAKLSGDHPEVSVLALTTFDTDDMALGAISAGAAGFLLKDTPPAQLVEAITKVAAKEHVLAPTALQALVRHVQSGDQFDRREQARTVLARLSPREREVAEAVAQGATNTEIAAALHLSVPTVKTHVSRVMERCELANRTQVALLVQQAHVC